MYLKVTWPIKMVVTSAYIWVSSQYVCDDNLITQHQQREIIKGLSF